MKRIANKVAVQTICYTLSGDQHIRIVDYSNRHVASNLWAVKDDPIIGARVLFDGKYCERNYALEGFETVRAFDSECIGLKAIYDTKTKESILLINTCIAEDEFK